MWHAHAIRYMIVALIVEQLRVLDLHIPKWLPRYANMRLWNHGSVHNDFIVAWRRNASFFEYLAVRLMLKHVLTWRPLVICFEFVHLSFLILVVCLEMDKQTPRDVDHFCGLLD